MKGIFVLIGALALTGCHSVLPSLSGQVDGDDVQLAGSRWRVETIAGGDLPASMEPTVEFSADGRVFGMAGCNRYSGRYRIDGARLRIEDLVTTQKICFPAIMAHEQSLLRVLQGAQRIERTDAVLLLESRNEKGFSRMAEVSGRG